MAGKPRPFRPARIEIGEERRFGIIAAFKHFAGVGFENLVLAVEHAATLGAGHGADRHVFGCAASRSDGPRGTRRACPSPTQIAPVIDRSVSTQVGLFQRSIPPWALIANCNRLFIRCSSSVRGGALAGAGAARNFGWPRHFNEWSAVMAAQTIRMRVRHRAPRHPKPLTSLSLGQPDSALTHANGSMA